eukprot:6733203-Karenia_brevis.AAC.1
MEELRPMQAMYSLLWRRFRCGPGLGRPFRSTNGILQGCPLSVLFLNALMSIWCSAVDAECGEAEPQLFADDT